MRQRPRSSWYGWTPLGQLDPAQLPEPRAGVAVCQWARWSRGVACGVPGGLGRRSATRPAPCPERGGVRRPRSSRPRTEPLARLVKAGVGLATTCIRLRGHPSYEGDDPPVRRVGGRDPLSRSRLRVAVCRAAVCLGEGRVGTAWAAACRALPRIVPRPTAFERPACRQLDDDDVARSRRQACCARRSRSHCRRKTPGDQRDRRADSGDAARPRPVSEVASVVADSDVARRCPTGAASHVLRLVRARSRLVRTLSRAAAGGPLRNEHG